MSSNKTNAARELDNLQIDYELKTYEFDEEHLNAEHIALVEGVPPEKIYKTLVLSGDKIPFVVAVIPANSQLDLKKLALASGNKKCEMLAVKDLLHITGYIRGGCSPIGMKKHFPTYIEAMVQLEEKIYISAGKRGLQIILSPFDLVKAVDAKLVDLV